MIDRYRGLRRETGLAAARRPPHDLSEPFPGPKALLWNGTGPIAHSMLCTVHSMLEGNMSRTTSSPVE